MTWKMKLFNVANVIDHASLFYIEMLRYLHLSINSINMITFALCTLQFGIISPFVLKVKFYSKMKYVKKKKYKIFFFFF